MKNVNHRHINRPLLSPQEGRLANTSAASNLHDATYYGFEEFIDRRGTTDDEDDLANWDEETTLVELLQVECVLVSNAAYMRFIHTHLLVLRPFDVPGDLLKTNLKNWMHWPRSSGAL